MQRTLAGDEHEYRGSACATQSTVASSSGDYGPCPFADLPASALDPTGAGSTEPSSQPWDAPSQEAASFSFDASILDDAQTVPKLTLSNGRGSTPVTEAVPTTYSPTSIAEVASKTDPRPPLCAEQQNVVNLVLQSLNVFYYGSAGTGKLFTLQRFVQELQKQRKMVYIITPTNLAARNIDGQTIWNYAGWTPTRVKKGHRELEQISRGTTAWDRFIQTDVLIIDEVSMIENHLFERLIIIVGKARETANRPSAQIIVTGDVRNLLLHVANSAIRKLRMTVSPTASSTSIQERVSSCGTILIADKEWKPSKYTCGGCGQVSEDIDKWAFRSGEWGVSIETQ